MGSIILTSTHLIDVKENHEDYSVPLLQIKEIHLFVCKSLGRWLSKIIVAFIFVLGPLYVLWHITDFLKKLFTPEYVSFWIVIILPALTILACGISFFRDFTNNKKYIKVELRTEKTRRMLYFDRKHISEQEVNSFLNDINAAMNEYSTSNYK